MRHRVRVMCARRVALTALPDFSRIVPHHSKERIITAIESCLNNILTPIMVLKHQTLPLVGGI